MQTSDQQCCRAIADLDRVLVIARLQQVLDSLSSFATDQVLSEAIVVFATDRSAQLGIALMLAFTSYGGQLSGRVNARRLTCATRRPTCFETFPQPALTERMDQVGQKLEHVRRGVMEQREDWTDRSVQPRARRVSATTRTSVRLREIHVEIDEAVREAYALDEEREPTIREYEAQSGVGAVAVVAGD